MSILPFFLPSSKVPLQYVGGYAVGIPGFTSGTTSVSLTSLTGGVASAPATGDIIVVGYGVATSSDQTLGFTDNGGTDYTYLCDLYQSDTYHINLRTGYKICNGDTNLLVGPTSQDAHPGGVMVHVWRNPNGTPIDVTTTTATGTNSTRADPPSITPVTEGAIIIACGAGSLNVITAGYTTSDLSNFVSVIGDDTNDICVGMGSKVWTSGAFDPAVFGDSTTSASGSWAAATMALRPK